MSREALTARISGLADAVLNDWRWGTDDLSVSILGMLLYGMCEPPREMGLGVADVDAAVLQCMTERIGATEQARVCGRGQCFRR